ncbi:hypothetical protein BaRGS_00008787, partial [Batillaria attramentaria]
MDDANIWRKCCVGCKNDNPAFSFACTTSVITCPLRAIDDSVTRTDAPRKELLLFLFFSPGVAQLEGAAGFFAKAI